MEYKDMDIKAVHAYWPERKLFQLVVDRSEDYYVFVHFHTEVELLDGEIARPGGCILYRPYSYRYIYAKKSTLYHDWIHIGDNLEPLIDRYHIECNRVYYPENDHLITELISDLETELRINTSFCDDICSIKIREILIKMTRESCAYDKIQIDADMYKKLFSVRQSLQTRYNEITNVEELAGTIGLSASRFYVLYNQTFGISPKRDLINIRMEHAKHLLKHHFNVSETAELVGYNDICHFSRQFKKYTDMTPSQYRDFISPFKERERASSPFHID